MPETPGGLTQETQSHGVSTDETLKSKKKETLRDIRENRGAQPVRDGAQPFKREGKRVKIQKRVGHHPATPLTRFFI